MDWPSLIMNPSYVLQSCSFWHIFSQSAAERNTDEARPFCVRMMGRCVSAVRETQSASVVRNSLIEIMSSVGLKSGITFPPLLSMVCIVQNHVRKVNRVQRCLQRASRTKNLAPRVRFRREMQGQPFCGRRGRGLGRPLRVFAVSRPKTDGNLVCYAADKSEKLAQKGLRRDSDGFVVGKCVRAGVRKVTHDLKGVR